MSISNNLYNLQFSLSEVMSLNPLIGLMGAPLKLALSVAEIALGVLAIFGSLFYQPLSEEIVCMIACGIVHTAHTVANTCTAGFLFFLNRHNLRSIIG